MKETFVVAIDGPAGAGKSTIANLVAEHFNFMYIDTGAMYRALTLKAMRMNADLANSKQLRSLMDESKIDLKCLNKNQLQVFLDDKDVTLAIRSPQVTNQVFHAAKDAEIRKKMVELQRDLAKRHKKIVLEGRDIGTVVFPQADIKFFLDAKVEERAQRRFKEFIEKGMEVKLEQIKQDIMRRDKKDKTREVAPLKQAKDAIYMDTTELSIEEVLRKVNQAIENVILYS